MTDARKAQGFLRRKGLERAYVTAWLQAHQHVYAELVTAGQITRFPDDIIPQPVWHEDTQGPLLGIYDQYHQRRRRWEGDVVWFDLKVNVEIQGGTWSRGAHVRGAGYERDWEKYNELAAQGWLVLAFTSTHVKRRALMCVHYTLRALAVQLKRMDNS